jgi:hypothetical protein
VARTRRSPSVLVDSNVLLDIVGVESVWRDWSRRAIATAREAAAVGINPIIYAEVAVGFERIEDVDEALPRDVFTRLQLPWAGAFLAAKAFAAYRRAGGVRRSPLPDFYIGAHAAIDGMRLLTRDPVRYRTYFPRLELIAP